MGMGPEVFPWFGCLCACERTDTFQGNRLLRKVFLYLSPAYYLGNDPFDEIYLL